MKLPAGRKKVWVWLVVAVVVALGVIWSWSRVAEMLLYRNLHQTLTKESKGLEPVLAEIDFKMASFNPKSCIHPWGGSGWLAEVACQDIAHAKPNESLEDSKVQYEQDTAKFEAALADHGWKLGTRTDTLVSYKKTVSGANCTFMLDFQYDSVVECEKSVKVPVLPVPYFYEYYGGG